jgi:hypothetical protein
MGSGPCDTGATTTEEDEMGAGEEYGGLEEATRQIKEYAARQKVEIKLGKEQADALLSSIRGNDPKAPAEISFVVEGDEAMNLRVAGYWYAGDTCCV